MRSGRYKAQPVKRVWLNKDDGKQRPIGIPAIQIEASVKFLTITLDRTGAARVEWCTVGNRKVA
jgi:retron-type reverse transcriptase